MIKHVWNNVVNIAPTTVTLDQLYDEATFSNEGMENITITIDGVDRVLTRGEHWKSGPLSSFIAKSTANSQELNVEYLKVPVQDFSEVNTKFDDVNTQIASTNSQLVQTATDIGNKSILDWLPTSLAQAIKDMRDWQKQLAINVMTPPYNANPSKTAAQNTTAIQSALDTLNHVLIPDGTFEVNNITVNGENQRLVFNSKGRLKGVGSGDVVTLVGQYAVLQQAYISCAGTVVNGVITKGFGNVLDDCTITGASTNALLVDALETKVFEGKYKGGTSAGIQVLKPDLLAIAPYVEGNRDGIYTAGTGSITGYHIHSFGNSRHAFYLNGASFSQLTSCYADTSGNNGYEVSSTSAGLTLIDCWGYKSSNAAAGYSDFAFYSAQNVKLIGCRSSGVGAYSKDSSFKFDANSQVDLIGCYASEADANGAATNPLIRFTSCSGMLSKYNRATDVFQSVGTTISASSSAAISIKTTIPPLSTTPGILGFEIVGLVRDADNSSAAPVRFDVIVGSGVPSSVTTVAPASPIVTLSSPTFTDSGDGYYSLNFTTTNTKVESVQVAFNVRYLGTSRGFS